MSTRTMPRRAAAQSHRAGRFSRTTPARGGGRFSRTTTPPRGVGRFSRTTTPPRGVGRFQRPPVRSRRKQQGGMLSKAMKALPMIGVAKRGRGRRRSGGSSKAGPAMLLMAGAGALLGRRRMQRRRAAETTTADVPPGA